MNGKPPLKRHEDQEVCGGHIGIVFEEEETVWPKALF